jgi:hypothetical protein
MTLQRAFAGQKRGTLALLRSLLIGAFLLALSALAPARGSGAQAADAPLDQPHPQAGVWVVYRGANTAQDLDKPYIKGVMAYAKWRSLYLDENTYDWSKLDAGLDFAINQVGKKTFVVVAGGYSCNSDGSNDWPQFLKERIARADKRNNQGCYPLQFWDPLYIELYEAYIRALAEHLAEFDANDARPDETDVLFVRAQVMAVTMENLPNSYCPQDPTWCWQNLIPANGHVYQVDLTEELAYQYQERITLAYKGALQEAYARRGLPAPVPAAKAGSLWGPLPNLEAFVEQGIWFDSHSGTPNPAGWYYDMVSTVKQGRTRGTSESGSYPQAELLAQSNYWEILANLNAGIEFIGIYGTNRADPDLAPKGAISLPENQPAFEFAARYAGTYRDPARAPGAWIALRGWYAEYNWGSNPHHDRVWTNYQSLMRQYRPQDSIPLFGVERGATDGRVGGMWHKLYPVVHRSTPPPWDDEAQCRERGFPDCEYLQRYPEVYLGTSSYDNKEMYVFPLTDLGQVLYCGTQAFCQDPGRATRAEPMIWARQTDGANGHPAMYFDLDDRFAQSLNGQALIRVVYLDRGIGSWQLRYDGPAGPQTVALTMQKTDTGLWKEVLVPVEDALFANRGPGGTDLALHSMGDDDDIFHMVEVQRPQGPLPTFADVPPDHPYYPYIEALAQAGYIKGCSQSPPLYCPERAMNRAESAVFTVRGVHGADFMPPQPSEQVFGDVALDAWYADWVAQLWEDGFTAGCSSEPLLYCPEQTHTRAEGAVFFLRMMYGAAYQPPPAKGYFVDVPLDTWYARWVDAAWEAGIAEACGEEPLRYCPEEPLTRAAAAYMMARAKGLAP